MLSPPNRANDCAAEWTAGTPGWPGVVPKAIRPEVPDLFGSVVGMKETIREANREELGEKN